MTKRKPEPAADYVFDRLRTVWDGPFIKEEQRIPADELKAESFYLLFQVVGGADESITGIKDKTQAVKIARRRAEEHPARQFVVMKAEVIVRAKLTAPEIEQIEL